jgi:integrase/recombinase XerD
MFRFLATAEFNTVLDRASLFEGQTNCAGKLAAGVILGLHGLRCGEVCGVKVRDLESTQGILFVATIKKGRPRTVEIEPRIADWLALFGRGFPAASPLFRTCRGNRLHTNQIQRGWSRLSRKWLGRYVRFHALRHTSAQRLYEATGDLLKVQAFLGHKSLSSTQFYLSVGGSVREFMPRLPEKQAFKPLLFEAG